MCRENPRSASDFDKVDVLRRRCQQGNPHPLKGMCCPADIAHCIRDISIKKKNKYVQKC